MRQVAATAARGLALFLGAFAVANVGGGLVARGFDANAWWLDVRAIATPVGRVGLAATGLLLVAWAIRPDATKPRRVATRMALWTAAAVAACNAVGAWIVADDGRVDPFPVPFSALLVAALIALDRVVGRRKRAPGVVWPALPAAAGWAVVFALLQMLCFGRTSYERLADAIVVFGARAYADGRPSLSLADRVRTACRLWRDGRAPLLVVSGGPGDGAFHEADVMASMARREGVADSAIVVDRQGVSTRATVENVAALLRDRRLTTVLAVSHAYHLPRVKMAFDRTAVTAFTVPACESRSFAKTPLLVAREVAALWAYWWRLPSRPA